MIAKRTSDFSPPNTAYVRLRIILFEIEHDVVGPHNASAVSYGSGETEHEQNGVSEALARPLQSVQQALVLRKGILRMRGKAIKAITLKRL